MRSAAGLALLAAGAILTFAVSAQVPGINLRLAGVIVLVTGIVTLVTPTQVTAWLQRRSAPPADQAGPDEAVYPAYLLQDPAVLAAEVLSNARAGRGLRAVDGTGSDG
jgi:hypothetical protein